MTPPALLQINSDFEKGRWKPIYLVVGEELFQATELLERFQHHLLKDETERTFNYEVFDGEQLDIGTFRASLEMLPGLFSGDGPRLVVCHKFDRVSASSLDLLDSYFKNPSSTTCLLLLAAKIDKRKGWVKTVEAQGRIIELKEPSERDWPRWKPFFEKRIEKRIDQQAWEILLEVSGRSLSLLWAEIQKVITFVGHKGEITGSDMTELYVGLGEEGDVFTFADDVLCGRAFGALKKYRYLIRTGENEIKLLAILVRQFRLVDQCLSLLKSGIQDNKILGSRLGLHPFLVSRVIGQSRHQDPEHLRDAIACLAECDLNLKTGNGGLFDRFLLPYFAGKRRANERTPISR